MSTKKRILLVDDDTTLGDMLTKGLQLQGFEVYYQSSLTSIIPVINEIQPSIIILDVEIGTKDGINEAERILNIFNHIPIIFISAHTEFEYVERAMERGAVQYLKKPFHIRELASIANRFATPSPKAVAASNIILYPDAQTMRNIATKKEHKLSAKESKLLMLLIQNIEEAVSRVTIENYVWGDNNTTEAIINNTISRLRKYIEDDPSLSITTISKVGYKLTSE